MIVRDKAYREFVSGLECCVPGCDERPPGDPAHIEGAGTSMKGSDGSCIPLCRDHHIRFHAAGVRTFERRYHVDVGHEMARALHERLFGIAVRFPRSIVAKVFE